ncbi:hypothetical protein BUALT_Bualt18G0120800 [Buddleja alternifolia]|uniref:Uncharacterized protein n=1 Tax=Buddleja alternifolia TaxID=168488 RepID=A0AAV6W5D4_9LAMI|nr:hypothetical protein BUALT_Bualt18G0120800 [Buddleja alternifolia]
MDPNTIGGDDSKHQEDRESDAGEVSYHNPSTKGDEQQFEAGRNIADLPCIEELKIEFGEESNIVVEGANVVRVEREPEIEDESDKKDEIFEHDETDGGSSSGSSSSSSNGSDDESKGIESSQAVVDISPVVDPVNVADPVVENLPVVDLMKTSLSGEKAEVDSSSIVQSVFKVNGDISDKNEEEIVKSVETVATIPDQKECVMQESDDREKHSEVTEPLLAHAPHAVQTASWKSCCGLFEVFAGSGSMA